MNEGAKTGVFWGIAALLLVTAIIVARPRNEQDLDLSSVIEKPLFENFKDATSAAKLKIVKFNESQGEVSSFEVAKNPTTGAWTIPSAEGYPADATDQMRKAATTFVDTRILDVVSETPDEHASFGVLDPSSDKREVSDEGVGTLVEIQDADRNDLVELIVGDKVPGSESEVYVRRPTQDVVYRVKLSTDALTTSFTDWIEKDLLNLGSIDIRNVELKNYSAYLRGQSLGLDQDFDAELHVDDSGKWSLAKMVDYGDPQNPQELTSVPEGKELDTTKLNDLKNALDDLKIAGVRRKPEGLSADLKVDAALTGKDSALRSLFSRGFYPFPPKPGQTQGDVYAANGELLVSLRDGVEYVLRFGEIQGVAKEADNEKKSEEGEDDPAGLNRYLLVTARVAEDSFPIPELQQVPQTIADLDAILEARRKEAMPPPSEDEVPSTPADSADKPEMKKEEAPAENLNAPKKEEKKEDEKDASLPPALKEVTPKDDGKNTEEVKKETKVDAPAAEDAEKKSEDKPEVNSEEPVKDESEKGVSESSGSGNDTASGGGALSQDDAEVDDAKVDEATPNAPAGEAKPDADAKPADTKPEADTKSADKKDKDTASKDEEMTEQEKKELLEAEQEKITRQNQRLIDERNEKIEKARKRVRELNARFADWYYVVPESTYRKLRLRQDELFKPATPSTPSPGIGTTAPQP